jgi:hypothetical protein
MRNSRRVLRWVTLPALCWESQRERGLRIPDKNTEEFCSEQLGPVRESQGGYEQYRGKTERCDLRI